MKVTLVEINEIKLWDKNPKSHDIAGIKKSLQLYGFVAPVILRPDYQCVAGHGRIEATRQLVKSGTIPKGIKVVHGKIYVPAYITDTLTDDQWQTYSIIDNRLTELGRWDGEIMKALANEHAHDQTFVEIMKDIAKLNFDLSTPAIDTMYYHSAEDTEWQDFIPYEKTEFQEFLLLSISFRTKEAFDEFKQVLSAKYDIHITEKTKSIIIPPHSKDEIRYADKGVLIAEKNE